MLNYFNLCCIYNPQSIEDSVLLSYFSSNYYFRLFCSGEYYLGYTKFELQGVSWYNLIHPDCMKEVQSKHRQSKYKKFTSSSIEAFVFYLIGVSNLCHVRHLCDMLSREKLKREETFFVSYKNKGKVILIFYMHIFSLITQHFTLTFVSLKVFLNLCLKVLRCSYFL